MPYTPKYLTLDEAKDFLHNVKGDLWYDSDQETVRDDWILDDIADVEGDIDAHVLKICPNGIDTNSDETRYFLRSIAKDILLYRGYKRQDFSNIPESIANDHILAQGKLKRIANGEKAISCAVIAADPEQEAGTSSDGFFFRTNKSRFRADRVRGQYSPYTKFHTEE